MTSWQTTVGCGKLVANLQSARGEDGERFSTGRERRRADCLDCDPHLLGVLVAFRKRIAYRARMMGFLFVLLVAS
jgi:hypothetical protein